MSRKAVSGTMLTLLLLGILTLAFNVQPVKSELITITVPDDYERIQWAIGNASDGDTIFVRAGTYYEHLIVNKSLRLVGKNKANTIIDGNSTSTVITVLASNVTVIGITVQNGCKGILLRDCKDSVIEKNNITDTDTGIRLESSRKIVIQGSTITRSDIGLFLFWSDNNFVQDNMLDCRVKGIGLSFCYNNTIRRNNIINSLTSISFFESGDYLIYHNNFINNTWDPAIETPRYDFRLPPGNVWDIGYPSGGNYWSDYTGEDLYNGPHQNETGSDGIGDTPMKIQPVGYDWQENRTYNIRDRYPLMNPYISHEEMRVVYYEVLEKYDVLINELSTIRNLTYVFLATTIIFITTTAYLAVRKPKVKPKK